MAFSPRRPGRRPLRRRTALACVPCHLLQSSKQSIPARVASKAMFGILVVYKAAIDPLIGQNCRFVPTCSDYIKEAIETMGPKRGFVLGFWRVIRCNPAGGSGYDPVQWPPVGFRAGD